MSDTSLVFALSARDNTGPGMRSARQTVENETEGMADVAASNGSKMGTALAAAGAAAGALAGAAIVSTLAQAMDVSEAKARLSAQLANTTADVGAATDAMTNVFTSGWGESATEVGDAIKSVTLNMDDFAGNQQGLEDMTTKAMALAKAFDQDINKATAAAGQMVKTGMAKDFDEAMDLLAAGLSSVANKSDDLLDTFNEYSTQFRRIGLDGKTATGLLSQGLQAGARDADAVADALGIFGEMALAGGEQVNEAFASIGLSGEDIGRKMRAGGEQATQALQQTMDALRGTDDATTRLAAAQVLFGDLANTQADALYALDPASAAAAGGFDEVAGAADKVVDQLEDSPAMRMEAFKRGVQQNVIDFLGGNVLPAVMDFKDQFGKAVTAAWEEAGKGGASGVDRVLNFVTLLGQRIGDKVVTELLPKAIEGLTSFGQRLGEYAMSNPGQLFKVALIAGALVLALANLPLLIAGALAFTAGVIVGGFVAELLGALGEKIPRWWASFVDWIEGFAGDVGDAFGILGQASAAWFGNLWTEYIADPVSQQWNSLIGSVGALPGRAYNALAGLGSSVRSRAVEAFQSMKNGAVERATSLVMWVSGLPARLVGGMAGQAYRFYNVGLDFVYGIWDGISAAGGWLWSQVSNFASNYIVDPVKDFLHIGSPSKLAADEIGRWIPAGVAMGVEDNAGVVDAAMRAMVTPADYRPAPPQGMAGAAGTLASVQALPPLVLELRGGSRAFREFFQESVRVTAGGSVVKFAEG
ncbi:phage tail tape measure protein [Streptomyces sp. I5]|uniref:phage tail tape measure protein n=1 Tax=Streptomyces sp. I5 TaxID=2759947 RepID=UPI0018EE4C11|nr:phage tail tape measure protein [Streptomyces sp. I5]MBJ6633372.1 phage tail tape measure protein [Streptomyces sp. I5]